MQAKVPAQPQRLPSYGKTLFLPMKQKELPLFRPATQFLCGSRTGNRKFPSVALQQEFSYKDRETALRPDGKLNLKPAG
ncbi:hypothetical protein [Akkermansia sp.]|uniref:hypothetical protein n=1 Tax=Akkermansia sp. TaxID=1872421 RepID=UPI0025BCD47B|nr:hypothetical protein [Akkermansia sp.]